MEVIENNAGISAVSGRSNKTWTKAEKQQLSENWGQYSVDTLAKRLGRSRNAVIVMVARLGLGAHLGRSSMISFNVLLKELGFFGGYEWMLEKFENAGLKIHLQRVRDNSFRMVDLEEFWTFAEKTCISLIFLALRKMPLGASRGG